MIDRQPRRRLGAVCAVLALALILILLPATASAAPAPKPELSGDAGLVIDAKTGELIWGRNVEEKHAIASVTKMMTVLVARGARMQAACCVFLRWCS